MAVAIEHGEDGAGGDQRRPARRAAGPASTPIPAGRADERRRRRDPGGRQAEGGARPRRARVCSASSIRTTWPGVKPSALSIARSRRCISTRPDVTLAIAHGAATSAMMPNSASSSPSSRSSLAIESMTCCLVVTRSTGELSLAPL